MRKKVLKSLTQEIVNQFAMHDRQVNEWLARHDMETRETVGGLRSDVSQLHRTVMSIGLEVNGNRPTLCEKMKHLDECVKECQTIVLALRSDVNDMRAVLKISLDGAREKPDKVPLKVGAVEKKPERKSRKVRQNRRASH
jgi:hypothetical protein